MIVTELGVGGRIAISFVLSMNVSLEKVTWGRIFQAERTAIAKLSMWWVLREVASVAGVE